MSYLLTSLGILAFWRAFSQGCLWQIWALDSGPMLVLYRESNCSLAEAARCALLESRRTFRIVNIADLPAESPGTFSPVGLSPVLVDHNETYIGIRAILAFLDGRL